MRQRAENQLKTLLQRYPALRQCGEEIHEAAELLASAFVNGGKLLVCGNGGSAADSMHIVGELMKGFVLPRRLTAAQQDALRAACPEMAQYCIDNLQQALPAISLVSESALSTAYANDQAPDLAFAQQVLGQGRAGDVLLGISTSGNSANVLYAAGVAKSLGMKVIGLTGEGGGRLHALCDTCVCVPAKETYQIQEYHLPVYHALCLALEEEFFGENERR